MAAKGALYSTNSLYESLGSNYGSVLNSQPFFQPVVTNNYVNSGLVILDQSGNLTNVLKPEIVNGNRIKPVTFLKQLNNNFGQSIGISLSVPIFNGWQARASYERSKLNIRTLEYQRDLDNQTLKQDIYQAYNAAIVALEKFNSSATSVDAAQRTYDFALKRFNIGMLGTFELVTDQNNLFRAKLPYVLNQFDYVFKMKVLEFYKGQGIKL